MEQIQTMNTSVEASTDASFIPFTKSAVEPTPAACQFCSKDIRYSRGGSGWSRGNCDCDEAVTDRKRYLDTMSKLVFLDYQREIDEGEQYFREERRKELWEDSQLPARFRERTFENFRVSPHNKDAFEIAVNYAADFQEKLKNGKGLVFGGSVGTGKTHLAAAIAQHVLINHLDSVKFGTMASLLTQIKDTYDQNSKYSEQTVMSQLTRFKLLVIDDLGKESPTPWVQEKLFEIINARYEDNKPTIITTNTTLSVIEKRYGANGPAIVSRILEMCDGVTMTGNDFRKEHL